MEDNTPVLIGQGQFTYHGAPAEAPSPLQLLLKATGAAARDAGLTRQALAGLDGVGVVAFAIDAEGALAALPVPRLSNPPASLARRLDASPRWSAYTQTGGNSSQHL
ncbi:MAG TPA: acetyl-CoA acetyltransferase, partial [Caulobacteraceae bacterium]|nr:acetyl-CoA acetyltransferase [Caulobacteraceae bacterium]